jgi:hypothetical protein
MRKQAMEGAQLQQLNPMAIWAKVGHPHRINVEGQLIASKEN